MNERFLKKLSKLLIKSGLDEEKIKQIMSSVTAEDEPEEEAPVEEVSEEVETEEPTPVEDAAPETESEVPEETPVEQPAEDMQPAHEEASETEENGIPGQPEMPVAEPQPAVDYQPQIDEMKAALEGMSARIESLLENLTKSGILSVVDEKTPIGVENNNIPANQTSAEDAMQCALNKLNRGSF